VKAKKYLAPDKLAIVEGAYNFALKAHEGQVRKSGEPFIEHPLQVRLRKNPLRLLDCKQPQCQQIANLAPRSTDYLCPECATHFKQLQRYLGLLNLPFEVNHRLVRGLDYYTRTVFEIQPEEEGAQSTLGGGGRYDDLIEELGGKPTPAIGFAAGLERIILN
ncbi:unnamed protein product, partial [marine sediment metagenome]